MQVGLFPTELFYIQVFESCHDLCVSALCFCLFCILYAFCIGMLFAVAGVVSLQRLCLVFFHFNYFVCIVYFVS